MNIGQDLLKGLFVEHFKTMIEESYQADSRMPTEDPYFYFEEVNDLLIIKFQAGYVMGATCDNYNTTTEYYQIEDIFSLNTISDFLESLLLPVDNMSIENLDDYYERKNYYWINEKSENESYDYYGNCSITKEFFIPLKKIVESTI